MIADLIGLVVILVVLGFVVWLVQTLIPIAEPFRKIGIALLSIVVLLMVIGVLFGSWHPPHTVFG